MDLMAISDGEWLILGDAPNFFIGMSSANGDLMGLNMDF